MLQLVHTLYLTPPESRPLLLSTKIQLVRIGNQIINNIVRQIVGKGIFYKTFLLFQSKEVKNKNKNYSYKNG